MTVNHQIVVTACALILSAGIANAGPCTSQTTGTGDGQQASNRAAQADERQEHAQPSVAEQPKSTGKAVQPSITEQTPEPSAKMTDQDRFSKDAIGGLRGIGQDGRSRLLTRNCHSAPVKTEAGQWPRLAAASRG